MEFNEKLQGLRRSKGLTQEQLADSLYVSRTAVSKWESGRGYPSIESLKMIAKFFSVTVDQLISSEEVLTIAEQDKVQSKKRFCDIVYGALDLCALLLFFLPFFADRGEMGIREVSLLNLVNTRIWLSVLYYVIVIAIAVMGCLALALQQLRSALWIRWKIHISLFLSGVAVLIFVLSLQPYAAVFMGSLLAVKAVLLIKHR